LSQVGDSYTETKFIANPSKGGRGLLGEWVKYSIFLFIPSFSGTHHTGQIDGKIFTLNGSNNADSCKDVPFGGFVDIALHL